MAERFVDIYDKYYGLFFVKDTLELSGRFIALESLLHFIKGQVKVIYVSVDQSFTSTKVPLRKCGLNPTSLIQSGQLVVVDQPSNPEPGSTALATLQSEISNATKDATGSWRGIAIVLDDLSVLAAVAGDPCEVVAFVTWCRHLLAADAQVPHWLVAVAHTDIPADRRWLTLLEHQCEVAVEVEAVAGGMADLQGQATITHRGATSALKLLDPSSFGSSPQQQAGYQAVRRLFFRVGDTAIRWVPQPSVYGT